MLFFHSVTAYWFDRCRCVMVIVFVRVPELCKQATAPFGCIHNIGLNNGQMVIVAFWYV